MNFKIGTKVFYPSHGAGWIKQEKEIEFNGEKKQYFEFEFINSPISISIPIDNIDNLNVRAISSTKSIKEKISVLKKKSVKDPNTTDFNKLMELFKKLEQSASIENSIETIQVCNHIKKEREKDGRLIPVTIENELNRAINNIVGELAVSSGTKLYTAAKTFEKITGLETKIEE